MATCLRPKRRRAKARTQVGQIWIPTLNEQLQFFVGQTVAQKKRSMLQWARDEFVIPKGDFAGRKFREYRAPWAAALLHEFDRQLWRRNVVTGCVQSGKTLITVVLVALYYALELEEDVICGIPSAKMANDKWEKEFLPAIWASRRFREMLPQSGKGSRSLGLDSENSFTFRNGATLKFMTGVGRDEERSAYTSRILVVTEADRMDTSSETSREADQIKQLEARTLSYEDRARIYLECTTTIPKGKIWVEYNAGTRSRLYVDCPHCHESVSPEREHLKGHDSPLLHTVLDAQEATYFACPSCSAEWSDEERKDACRNTTQLVHRGQTIARGQVTGPDPRTDTFGFRWNGFHNLFWSPGFIGKQEFRCRKSRDRDNLEKETRQWFWSLPAIPLEEDLAPLSLEDCLERKNLKCNRSLVPPGTLFLTAATDARSSQLHYAVCAWQGPAAGPLEWPLSGQVIDYGIVKVRSKEVGEYLAIIEALNQLADGRINQPYYDADGRQFVVQYCPIDAGWKPEPVRAFCRSQLPTAGNRFMPSFGRGQSQPRGRGSYAHPDPTKESKVIVKIGDQWHIRWHDTHELYAIMANSDAWKTNLKDAFSQPQDTRGAIQLFNAVGDSHEEYLRHLCAETQMEVFVPGRGPVVCWTNETGRVNHFADVSYMMMVAGNLACAMENERRLAELEQKNQGGGHAA